MTEDLDPLLAALARLDPATDAPPEPGSARYDSILEHAMTPTTDPDLADAGTDADLPAADTSARPTPVHEPVDRSGADHRRPRPLGPVPRRRTLRRSLGASVAVAAALVVGLLVARPGDQPVTPTPTAALRAAADGTAAVTSLRATSTVLDRSDPAATTPATFQVEVAGDASRLTYAPRTDPGLAPEFALGGVHTRIGLDEWFTQDGETTHTVVDEEQTNLPFGPSSATVVRAALSSSQVREVGTDEVRGEDTTHYRITLDVRSRAALADLSPRVVAQFELESPEDVQQLDIWVADDLIRRIRIDGTDRLATIEYYDFGAEITITPPA